MAAEGRISRLQALPTPHEKTPEEQLIYRYPLAAAIADRLVKTPVLVGRNDDRGGETLTKLQDGIRLLEAKRETMERWCAKMGKASVNPVLLVIAQTTDGADEIEALVKSEQFFGGRYADAVLTVHSKTSDDALAQLETVEDPDTPVRIIVSVGMLKEGWDVKNVYAICSLRPLLSDVLTEQTLGRGLRLPWGEYTDVRLLDTLEVLAHERYEALLKKTGVINESFVDYRTRIVVTTEANGDQSARAETVLADVEITDDADATGAVVIEDQEQRERKAADESDRLAHELRPRGDLPALRVPRLRMTKVAAPFSLADITDFDAFEKVGRRFASEPDDDLRRTVPLGEARERLLDALLGAEIVPARATEARAAEKIMDAFLAGLGDHAERVLSAYLDRAAGALVRAVTAEHRRFVGKPSFEHVVELIEFAPARIARATASSDRTGAFSKSVGYEGWRKSLYPQVWFDSGTERQLASILDDAEEIEYWVRLHSGDLPILWQSDGREYNPDFVAVERDGAHWLIESKMDKEMETEDVKGKTEAAKRWANHVSADASVGAEWRYLLASETDIGTARGSWPAVKKLGSA